MGSWKDVRNAFDALVAGGDETAINGWVQGENSSSLEAISRLRGKPVIAYASAFLQKPAVPAEMLSITAEDLNGFMSAIYGMDCTGGLTLVLHTPGGVTNAAETIVAYLRSKFPTIDVIVPTFAMSAGTMLALASDRIVMGRQSQLGPIDPQLVGHGRQMSARAITEQFSRASSEVMANTGAAHVWAPILQSLGPALLQEAENALVYSERMVAEWLANWMLKDGATAIEDGQRIAKHFNDASTHKSHGRRIDRDEAKSHGVVVSDLEDSQELQEAVLNLYHLLTVIFESSPMSKVIMSSTGATWSKQWTGVAS